MSTCTYKVGAVCGNILAFGGYSLLKARGNNTITHQFKQHNKR